MTTSTTTQTLTLTTPNKIEVNLCYKCRCGAEHWVEQSWVGKRGYTMDCWCGRTLCIKPVKVLVNKTDLPKTERQNTLYTQLNSIGYTKIEIKQMTSKFKYDTDDVSVLLKRALANKD